MTECTPSPKAGSGSRSASVAIVGAGAAGLVAAREIRREGHAVEVFEQQTDIGGVWVLDGGEPAKPSGGTEPHTSMYDSLRVNLPRELMSFSDFPFIPEYMQGRSVDDRRFPQHMEVRQYLEAFADHFGLTDTIQLSTRVTSVVPVPATAPPTPAGSGTAWQVTTVSMNGRVANEGVAGHCVPVTREYDAVLICSGHYTVPRMPHIEGLVEYPGKVEHSHLYRRPEAYSEQRVLIVGAFATGEDLAWDIAPFAECVTMSAKTWMQPHYADQHEPFGVYNNMRRRPWVSKMHADGSVDFEDGRRVSGFDVVLFCTGYQYTFPFLANDIVESTDSHVRPLYKHLLHPSYGASMAFIGLGYKNVPFLQCEIQSKYVSALLSGRAETPSQDVMEEWIESQNRLQHENRSLSRHIHCMALTQFAYNDELAAKCEGCATPAWRHSLVKHTMELWAKYTPAQYRDHWEDEEALQTTYAAFRSIGQEL